MQPFAHASLCRRSCDFVWKWLWIFESKGWVHFDNQWNVIREPTDEEIDEVTKAYLQRHGNYDTPDSTCLDDLRKREHASQRNSTKRTDTATPLKAQTEMSWPEMKQAYAARRAAEKQNKPEHAPPQADAAKVRRVDWDKILDGVRDILFDATEPMTATAIRQGLGENAPGSVSTSLVCLSLITTRAARLRLDAGSTVASVGGVSVASLSNPQLLSMNSQKTIRGELL